MREAVVVAHSRTPLAKSFRGSFNLTRPDDLAAHTITDVLKKVPQLDPAEIEDIYMGCANPEHTQGMNVARVAAIRAGLPVTVAGCTINRFCSSGLQAVAMASHLVLNENVDVALAGGVESITAIAGRKSEPNPVVLEKKPGIYMVMGDTAEVVAKRYNISREAQDEYSLTSQQRTAIAQAEGYLDEELAPMTVTRGIIDKATGKIGSTEEHTITKDECNRADTTLEGLLKLKPYFDPDSGKGSVTAGNASQMSDGASMCVVMSRERAEKLGIKPKLIFRGFQVAGCEPDEMGIGPVFAVPKLLKRNGLTVDDIGLWELNEAFAVQVLYCRDKLGIDPKKLNVNGGSIAIGHPFGMTGSRMVGTIANEMLRRKVKYGVVTMCIGGGQGAAGLFEACLSTECGRDQLTHSEPTAMQTLRTPDERFANLPDWPYEPRYVDVAGGLRMHYVEAGTGDPILCLHGEPSWGYLYRKMIPTLSRVGRVIVPDLIGFGRSDKPVGKDAYTYGLHHDAVASFVQQLDLTRTTLVCQDWGGLLGLPVAMEQPERFARLVVMNTGLPVSGKPLSPGFMAWRNFAEKSQDMDIGRVIDGATVSKLTPEVLAAYNAPFPDLSYKGGAMKFPLLVPISEDAEALPAMRAAAEKMKGWSKPALIMFSDKDPVTVGGDQYFRKLIPSAKNEPEITIRDAGHFLQEDKGEEIAEQIAAFIERRPID